MPTPRAADIPIAYRTDIVNRSRLHADRFAARLNHFFGIHVFRGASPSTGVVPGAGFFPLSLSLCFEVSWGGGAEGGVSFPTGVVPGAGFVSVGAAVGVSPPDGVVPGAGCAVGVPAGGVLAGADCAHAQAVNPSASAARAIACKLADLVLMPHLQREFGPGAEPLRSFD